MTLSILLRAPTNSLTVHLGTARSFVSRAVYLVSSSWFFK